MKIGKALLAFMIVVPSIRLTQSPDLRPISEYLSLPEENRDTAYPFLRCVGLFQGVFRYGGANFSEEMTLQTQLSNEAMAYVALMLRQDKHPEGGVSKLCWRGGLKRAAA